MNRTSLDTEEFLEFVKSNPQILKQIEFPFDFIDEKKVKDYILSNPNFFIDNAEILSKINFPHECGSAESLLLYQIKSLREEIKKRDRFLSELVSVAEANHSKLETIQELILELLDSPDNPVLFTNLQGRLRHNMSINQTKLFCYKKFKGLPQIGEQEAKIQIDLLGGARARFVHLDRETSEALSLSDIEGGSAALCRLESDDGLLVLGHKDAKHFTPDQDTLFIEYLASILSRLLIK